MRSERTARMPWWHVLAWLAVGVAAGVLILLVLRALPVDWPSWTGYALAGVCFTAVYIHIFRTWRANRRARPQAAGEATTTG